MSMKDYSFSDYGLLLNGVVEESLLEELAENEAVDFQFSFTGESQQLNDDGSVDWNGGESFDGDTVYYIPMPQLPTLFKPAYRDMDELLAVMLGRYDDVRKADGRLPELSARQVRSRLRKITGTYFG